MSDRADERKRILRDEGRGGGRREEAEWEGNNSTKAAPESVSLTLFRL